MKWLAYIFTSVIILLIGYWLGSKGRTPEEQNKKIPLEEISEPRVKQKRAYSATQANDEPTHVQTTKSYQPKTLTEAFTQALEEKKYALATTLLTEASNNSTAIEPKLKALYTHHVQQQLGPPNENRGEAFDAIEAYLGDFYDDTEMLLLLAKQHAYLNNFYEMLNTIQLAINYAYTNEEKKIVRAAYAEFISYTDRQLSELEQWEILISIYLHSENTGLLREQDILRLVELYIQQGEDYFATNYAERLAGKQQWQKQLSELLPQTATPSNTKETDMADTPTTIPLLKISDQFVITAELSGNSTKLLMDTGASITTLSKKYFESIKRQGNFSYQQKQTFLTANGETTGEIYTVDTLQIGQYLLEDLEIAVIDFSTSQHSSGLLGMNVLKRFKFEIDQINSLLALEKISP